MAYIISTDGSEQLEWYSGPYSSEPTTLGAMYDMMASILGISNFILGVAEGDSGKGYATVFTYDTSVDDIYLAHGNLLDGELYFKLDNHTSRYDVYYYYSSGVGPPIKINVNNPRGVTIGGVSEYTGFSSSIHWIYCKNELGKNLYVDNVPVISYNLTSLRYVDGADKTLWLTKIPDEKIFEGNYATSFGTEEKWFTPEDRSNFRSLSYGPILTINTENVSGVIELMQGNPDYLRISYHSGEITAVVNQNLDHDNYPVGVTPLYTYLSLYEDAEQNVATFAISGVHPESGFFVEDLYFVNLNASAKSFLGTIGAEYLYRLIHAVPAPVIDGDDPYPFEPEAGPDSETGDGQLTSDPNGLTELPPSIASDIGFLTLFNPSQSEVKELATYMWTDDLFDVANFKKIFANPMDCILGFMAYPFVVSRSGIGNLVVGNISTDIPIHLAASEFQDVDLGTQKIPAPLGSFLDYAPFTKLMVYLPFCGEHQLDIDRYSGKTVNLTYRVNLLTGACVAILRDTDNGSNATNILDMFHGNMAYNIPLTSTNFENAMGAVIGITAGVVGGVAGVAMGGALSGASIANVAQNVTNLKPTIETAGSMAASVGSVASLAPFFRYVEPRLADSKNKNNLIGTPSCVTRELSGLKGYVEVTEVDTASDIATTNELDEIQSLLKGGVYIEDLPLPE